MLADAHAGEIDHHQLAIVIGRNRRQQPIPDPDLAPADEAKQVVEGP